MRGALDELVPLVQIFGIIPADAGSTSPSVENDSILSDHPRGCGEHSSRTKNLNLPQGSSPRMRGARISILVSVIAVRIIPADAGSTDGDI